MNLDQFIAYKKRMTQYGNPDQVNDQAAKDIVASINDGIDRIAKNWLWDWLYEPFSITLIPGTVTYTLPVNIKKIIGLDAGNGPLENITYKEYLNFWQGNGSNLPAWYMYIGRDALTGARKVWIGGIPTTNTDLFVLGKQKVTRFSEADLGTAKSMLPFPEDGESILSAFVEADIYRLQGKKDLIFPQEQLAEAKLKAWRGEESTEPANNAASNLPSFLRVKMANRRNGYVV